MLEVIDTVVDIVGVDGGRGWRGVNETQPAMREMCFQSDWQQNYKDVVEPCLRACGRYRGDIEGDGGLGCEGGKRFNIHCMPEIFDHLGQLSVYFPRSSPGGLTHPPFSLLS